MAEADRKRFDLLLVESMEQTEAREVQPLLAMMGGVKLK
jgi:hypothetical protein